MLAKKKPVINAKHAATIGAVKARLGLPVDPAFMGFTSLSNGSCVAIMEILSAQWRYGLTLKYDFISASR